MLVFVDLEAPEPVPPWERVPLEEPAFSQLYLVLPSQLLHSPLNVCPNPHVVLFSFFNEK